MPSFRILEGDCLETLKQLPDNSIDSVCTDPPYGLGEVKDLPGLLNAWLTDEDTSAFVGAGGFMSAKWDNQVPRPAVWREVFRVLKPGGHLCAFAGTRTQDLMGISLRLAGFEIRDELAWLYSTGYPKSLDVSKAIRKQVEEQLRAQGAVRDGEEVTWKWPATRPRWRSAMPREYTVTLGERAYTVTRNDDGTFSLPPELEVSAGTSLKPAHEPIILCRKPLSERTVALNVLKHGTAGLHVDACRVAGAKPATTRGAGGQHGRYGPIGAQGRVEDDNAGRFPPNLLCSHHPDCRRVGERKVRSGGDPTAPRGRRGNGFADIGAPSGDPRPNGPTYGTETVATYACAPGCPVAALDAQSEGSSRFFPALDFDPEYDVPFLYQAKAPKRERNAGLDHLPKKLASVGHLDAAGRDPTNPRNYRGGQRRRVDAGLPATEPRANTHPTVKPISLMRWLCRLITPPGGRVLDPFAGSGTTGCAAVLEGFDFIGCELSPEYAEIARARIAHWAGQAQAGGTDPEPAKPKRPRKPRKPAVKASDVPAPETDDFPLEGQLRLPFPSERGAA